MNIKIRRMNLLRPALLIAPGLLMLSACSDDDKKSVVVEPPTVVEPLITNLVEAADKANKKVGAALSNGVLTNDETAYIDIVKKEFNYATPENVGKWGSIQDTTPDEWDFSELDSMVAFVEENNIAFKGHALVWHNQAPSFVNSSISAEELTVFIDDHINMTAGRYSGQFYSWDVVNEAIGDDANYRDSVLFQKLGKDFIAQSFNTAHAAAPEAKLFYNDYNIANINAKSDTVFTMVKELLDNDIPIHGVGFQMHLDAANAPTTAQMTENLKRFADLGIDVNISEIDIRVSSLPWDTVTKLAIQQQVYHRAVNACINVDRCDAITLWGFTDKYSWVDGFFGPDDPLLYTAEYERKPAYYAVADALLGIEADSIDTLPNLIANGNFEIATDGWTTLDETALRTTVNKKNGITSLLASANDTNKAKASIDITNLLIKNRVYNTKAWVMAANESAVESTLNSTLQCAGEDAQTVVIHSTAASNTEFTQLSGTLTVPNCDIESATLNIEGPAVSEDIYIDAVSLRPQALIPNTEGFGDNILSNSDFEIDASDWSGYDMAEVAVTTTKAFSGSQSIVATNRVAEYDGPSYNIFDLVETGETYQIFARASVSEGSAQVKATIRAVCSDGDRYIGIAGASANATDWALMAGQATIPNCALSDAILYFEGPSITTDIYIDDVTLHEKVKNLSPNLVQNSDFEVNTDGWAVWAGALAISENFANTGAMSALHSSRTDTWQGPVFNLLPYEKQDSTYEISVFARIENASAETMGITLKTQCEGQDAVYTGHGSVAVTNSEWTELKGSLELPECTLTSADIYFDGPAAGVDIYVDTVSITSNITIDPDNLFTNSTFESGINGWSTWGANIEESTEFAHTGEKSALVNSRTQNWQGPLFDFIGKGLANTTYSVSGWVRVAGSASEEVSITVKQTCEGEAEEYIGAATATTVTDSDWTQISGSFTTPDCNLSELFVYFDNAAEGVDVYLDDAVLKAVLE